MMRGLMPWAGMGNLRHEMDRLFDRLGEMKWDDLPALGEWTPSMDISETKDSLVAKIEAPGMEQKDIQISLQENLLTIKGEKKQEKEEREVACALLSSGSMGTTLIETQGLDKDYPLGTYMSTRFAVSRWRSRPGRCWRSRALRDRASRRS